MEIFNQLDMYGMLLMTAMAMCVGLVVAIVWIIRDDSRQHRARLERDYRLFKIEHDAKRVREAENDEYYKRFGR